jgi:hypothetical protein
MNIELIEKLDDLGLINWVELFNIPNIGLSEENLI